MSTKSKGMYLNVSFHITGEREIRGLIGEQFNIGKNQPVPMSDLIITVSILACDFADQSKTYTPDEIRKQYRDAVCKMSFDHRASTGGWLVSLLSGLGETGIAG